MKKISILLIVFLLMINFTTFNVNATENVTAEATAETVEETATEDVELVQNNELVINTYGKIIKAGEVKETVTGTVTEKIQEVTVEITEGDYIGDEFTTNYILSYDIDGKILAYELEEGNKVSVQIIQDGNGITTATVLDVVRANHIIVMAIIFLASVIIIGGRKGIKAVFGLLYTIVLIYFVMIRRIFNGDNAITNSIITVSLVILGTFIIIGDRLDKKVLTAAIGTVGGVLSAGIMALIFNNLAKLTGAGEDAIQLSINMTTINFNFTFLFFNII